MSDYLDIGPYTFTVNGNTLTLKAGGQEGTFTRNRRPESGARAAAEPGVAASTTRAQSGTRGTQSNPYDWSTTAAQLDNADIPAGSYIKTASGSVRRVTAGEIDWTKKEAAKRKGGSAAAQDEADFETQVMGGGVGIYGYTGKRSDVAIPEKIGGRPVTFIYEGAFHNQRVAITSVTFASGSNIASGNFGSDESFNGNLQAVYLAANPHSGTYTRAAGGSTWTKVQ